MSAKPTCIDLFAGAGGLSLGLKLAGWKTLVAAEYDAAACATYRQNFSGVEVAEGDVRSVDWSSLVGKVDLVAGGPPCQPFSVAGNQLAQDDSRDMLPEFVRAVQEIKPGAFLLENVAGLTTAKNLPYLQAKVAELAALGFEVKYKVLNAADFGVPQERLRVIVIGQRRSIPTFPSATHGPSGRPYVSAGAAIRKAIQDEPNTAIVTYAKNPVIRPSPWAGMLVNGGGRPIDLSSPSQTIPASAGGNRTHIVDEDAILLEYHQDLMEGRAPRQGLVKGVRRLTATESASLQTFPPEFKFAGRRSSQYRQIGNAVPVLLAKAVGAHIRNQL